MGIMANLLIIFTVISIVLTLSNPSKWGSPLVELIVTFNSGSGEINIGGLLNKALVLAGVGLLLGVGSGQLLGDPSYGLFAGFVTFMLGFAVLPFGFFVDGNIPFFIKAVVGIPLAMMYVLGLIGWYRGSEL
jgi:hypothetical protein